MNFIIFLSISITSVIMIISLLYKEILPQGTAIIVSHYFYSFVSKFVDTRKLKSLCTCNQLRNYKKYDNNAKICTFVAFKRIKNNNKIIDDMELIDLHSILNFGNGLDDNDQSVLIKKFRHILGLDASTMLIRYVSTIFGHNKNYKDFDPEIINNSFDEYVKNDLNISVNSSGKKLKIKNGFEEKINSVKGKLIIILSLVKEFNEIINMGNIIVDDCIVKFEKNKNGGFINVQDTKNRTIDSFYHGNGLILFNFIINLMKLKNNHGMNYSLINGEIDFINIGKLKIYHGFKIMEIFKMSEDHKISMVKEGEQPKEDYYIQNNESGFTVILATIFMCLMSFSELYDGKTKEIIVYISVFILFLSCLFTMQRLYKFIIIKMFVGMMLNLLPGGVSSFFYNKLPTFTPCNYKSLKIMEVNRIFALNTTAMRNFRPTGNKIIELYNFDSMNCNGSLLINMGNSSVLIKKLIKKTGGKYSCSSYNEIDRYYKITWNVFDAEILSTNISSKFEDIVDSYINIMLTLNNNEIDGISDGNEEMGSRYIHFLNPIEIFNEMVKSYNSKNGLDIFSEWEAMEVIYSATTQEIKIEITKAENEIRKISGLLEDKSYCFINHFKKEFFRGTGVKGLRGLEIIPGSIPKNSECDINNKILKRYMCDLSKLYEFLGYKKLRMVGKFNDSRALKKVIEMIKSKDVKIDLKINGENELSAIEAEFEFCEDGFYEKISDEVNKLDKEIDESKKVVEIIKEVENIGDKISEEERTADNLKFRYKNIDLKEGESNDFIVLFKSNKLNNENKLEYFNYVNKNLFESKLKLGGEIKNKRSEIEYKVNNHGLLKIKGKKERRLCKTIENIEGAGILTSQFKDLNPMLRANIESSILSKMCVKITNVNRIKSVKEEKIKDIECINKEKEEKKETFKVNINIMDPISSTLEENKSAFRGVMERIKAKQSKIELIKTEEGVSEVEQNVRKSDKSNNNNNNNNNSNKKRKRKKGVKFGTRSLVNYRKYYNHFKGKIQEMKGKTISCIDFPIFGKSKLGQKNSDENKVQSNILKNILKDTQFKIFKTCLNNIIQGKIKISDKMRNMLNIYIDKYKELKRYNYELSSGFSTIKNLKNLRLTNKGPY